MSGDDEAKLRRAAIVLRDMCASNTSSTLYQNHDPELEHEGVDADEVYPGVFIGTTISVGSRLFELCKLTKIRGAIQYTFKTCPQTWSLIPKEKNCHKNCHENYHEHYHEI